MNPSFSPPLHVQRHQFVVDFVMNNKPKKVADLGCGECRLLKRLKFHREIELLVGVDISGTKVKKNMYALAPIAADYLQPRCDPLRVELYQGSVTQRDTRLRGFDLVSSIELIEHLSLADVEHFSEVVFGYMTPAAVIISTPNSEFNPLFPRLTGFRHSDHKFEWTRAEFRSWAMKVCLDYGYEVELTGVGLAPPDQQEAVGFCSQIGVFHRLGGRDSINLMCCDDGEGMFSYTQLYSINYPSLNDNNSLQRVPANELMEGRMSEGNEALPPSHVEGDGGCEACMAVQNVGTEEESTECGEELKHPTELGQSSVASNSEGECEEVLCINRTSQRCVCWWDSFRNHKSSDTVAPLIQ